MYNHLVGDICHSRERRCDNNWGVGLSGYFTMNSRNRILLRELTTAINVDIYPLAGSAVLRLKVLQLQSRTIHRFVLPAPLSIAELYSRLAGMNYSWPLFLCDFFGDLLQYPERSP